MSCVCEEVSTMAWSSSAGVGVAAVAAGLKTGDRGDDGNKDVPDPRRRRLAEQALAVGGDVLQELMVATECSICMERPASTAFTCGHCFCCQMGCETLV